MIFILIIVGIVDNIYIGVMKIKELLDDIQR